jgi:putative Mg2+ transporter-C (MgtC) family protein
MDVSPTLQAALHIFAAWAAGALIGWERESHGRAAGLRTHSLVALASALMMAVAGDPQLLIASLPDGVARIDATHLAQGIMTGIGFLGAGVIFKEGPTVHGLTTAASIWTTAALGVLLGAGFMTAGVIGAIIALLTLSLFRRIEQRMGRKVHAVGSVRFRRTAAPDEAAFIAMIAQSSAAATHLSYRMDERDAVMEYRFSLLAPNEAAMSGLVERLRGEAGVEGFELNRNGG